MHNIALVQINIFTDLHQKKKKNLLTAAGRRMYAFVCLRVYCNKDMLQRTPVVFTTDI